MTANTQLSLVFAGTTAQRFEDFHRSNPHVYRTLVSLARQWINQTGQRRLGIKTLYERARWEIAVDTNDPDFELNNNYTAFYARLLMALNPELDGMFELRSSAADEWLPHYLAAGAA